MITPVSTPKIPLPLHHPLSPSPFPHRPPPPPTPSSSTNNRRKTKPAPTAPSSTLSPRPPNSSGGLGFYSSNSTPTPKMKLLQQRVNPNESKSKSIANTHHLHHAEKPDPVPVNSNVLDALKHFIPGLRLNMLATKELSDRVEKSAEAVVEDNENALVDGEDSRLVKQTSPNTIRLPQRRPTKQLTQLTSVVVNSTNPNSNAPPLSSDQIDQVQFKRRFLEWLATNELKSSIDATTTTSKTSNTVKTKDDNLTTPTEPSLLSPLQREQLLVAHRKNKRADIVIAESLKDEKINSSTLDLKAIKSSLTSTPAKPLTCSIARPDYMSSVNFLYNATPAVDDEKHSYCAGCGQPLHLHTIPEILQIETSVVAEYVRLSSRKSASNSSNNEKKSPTLSQLSRKQNKRLKNSFDVYDQERKRLEVDNAMNPSTKSAQKVKIAETSPPKTKPKSGVKLVGMLSPKEPTSPQPQSSSPRPKQQHRQPHRPIQHINTNTARRQQAITVTENEMHEMTKPIVFFTTAKALALSRASVDESKIQQVMKVKEDRLNSKKNLSVQQYYANRHREMLKRSRVEVARMAKAILNLAMVVQRLWRGKKLRSMWDLIRLSSVVEFSRKASQEFLHKAMKSAAVMISIQRKEDILSVVMNQMAKVVQRWWFYLKEKRMSKLVRLMTSDAGEVERGISNDKETQIWNMEMGMKRVSEELRLKVLLAEGGRNSYKSEVKRLAADQYDDDLERRIFREMVEERFRW